MKWTEAFKLVFAMVAAVGGASAIILILSSWLGKVWGQRILARERAELHRLAKQHEISFSQLHVERAHVIKVLYEKLVDLYDSMQSLLKYFQGADEPSLDEKAQVFRDAHNEFIRAVARPRVPRDQGDVDQEEPDHGDEIQGNEGRGRYLVRRPQDGRLRYNGAVGALPQGDNRSVPPGDPIRHEET